MTAATPALTASFARTVRLRPNGVTQRMVSMPPRHSMANSPEKQIAQASVPVIIPMRELFCCAFGAQRAVKPWDDGQENNDQGALLAGLGETSLPNAPGSGGLGIGLFEVVGSHFSGLYGGTRRAGLGLVCFF